MRVLCGHDAEVAHWVSERIPHLRERIPYYPAGQVLGPATALGVIDDAGTLIAGVIFHNFDPFLKSIEVSCAAEKPGWANREVLRTLLRYPFDQCKVRRITAATPRRASPGTTSPRKFLEGLGFVREGSIRFGFGDQNAIVYGLLAEDWAAHRINRRARVDGEEVRTSSAASA